MKINGRLILFTVILVAMATACKILFGADLDWSGFSPVIAIALFSGMIIPQRNRSFLLPLMAVFVSDLVIEVLYRQDLFAYPGIYSGQWKNYLLLLSATLIGWLLKGRSYTGILVGSIVAPTLFYLLSNFSIWASPGAEAYYSRDFKGLMTCYTAALPFYKNGLMATIVFVPVILFLYNYIGERRKAITVAY